MDGSHIDHIDQPATAAGHSGRRSVLRAVGAFGVALLAALGKADSTAAKGFRTKRVDSDPAGPLETTAGDRLDAFADCNGGKLLSCGYLVGGQAAELVNTMVTFAGPVLNRTGCDAALVRTASAGSTAGATITAVALCRV
jgi:hypothetical protein